jgi:hypothetical protein
MMEAEFSLTENDWLVGLEDANRQLAKFGQGAAANRKGLIFFGLATVIFATVLLSHSRNGFAAKDAVLALIVGVLLTFCWLAWKGMQGYSPKTQLAALRSADAADLFAPRRVVIDQTGIRQTTRTGETFATWSSIKEIGVLDDHVCVYTTFSPKLLIAIIVPQSAFSHRRDFEGFCMSVSEFWQAARSDEAH